MLLAKVKGSAKLAVSNLSVSEVVFGSNGLLNFDYITGSSDRFTLALIMSWFLWQSFFESASYLIK